MKMEFKKINKLIILGCLILSLIFGSCGCLFAASKATKTKTDETTKIDLILKDVEIQKELLLQKEKTHDSFLSTFQVTVSVFSVLFALVLFVLGFLGYNSIREMKESVTKELTKDFDDKAQKIIKTTIESLYKQRLGDEQGKISEIETYLEKLEIYLKEERKEAGKGKIPRYREKTEPSVDQEDKNVFDEDGTS